MSLTVLFGCLLVALALDWVLGDPPWLWRRVPHPVALFGLLIERLDRRLNLAADSPKVRRMKGAVALALVLLFALSTGAILHGLAKALPFGVLIEVFAIAVMIAQRDLADHVRAVLDGLGKDGIDGGRRAVARIVGRNPDSLDQSAICRAAIESLAENFADGVVAPVIWYAVFGLPGLFAYKMLNTADSMIGHRTDRHRDFGWAAARADDFANLPASRLSALLIATAAWIRLGRAAGRASVNAVAGSARRHRSPNAGWPEAAMAGALDIALAGPRRYGDELVDDAWMNPDGRRDAEPSDVARALSLFRVSCLFLAVLVGLLFLASLSAGI